MPIYELRCKKCGEKFEIMSPVADMDKNCKKAKCEHCGSKSKERVVSPTNFTFANPVGTARWNKSHDYRFKTKLPAAVQERENAQKKSHVGPTPYNNIDDISGGKYFGTVQ